MVKLLMRVKKTDDTEKSETSKTNSKAKCDVYGCIKTIKTTNTLEEINKIIGFEGEFIGKGYQAYYWQITEDEGVKVQFFDSGYCRIDIDYKDKSIMNKKADFSKWNEIKKSLNSGDKMTYDEFVKKVGGVEGTLETKDCSSLGYKWVNADGGYLTATFDAEDNYCRSASGRI